MREIALIVFALFALIGCNRVIERDTKISKQPVLFGRTTVSGVDRNDPNAFAGDAIDGAGAGPTAAPAGAMAGGATGNVANNLQAYDQAIRARQQEVVDAHTAAAQRIANAERASANFWTATVNAAAQRIRDAQTAAATAFNDAARAATNYVNGYIAAGQAHLQRVWAINPAGYAAAYNWVMAEISAAYQRATDWVTGVRLQAEAYARDITNAAYAYVEQVRVGLLAYVAGETNVATTYAANVTQAKTREIQALQAARDELIRNCPFGAVAEPWVHCERISQTSAGIEVRMGLRVGNSIRQFIAYLPVGLRPPSPVVLNFHGADGESLSYRAVTQFERFANGGNYILITPQGLGGWNAGSCCGAAKNNGVDDVGFVRALLDVLPNIDRNRVYAVGLSNGGMFAQRLACELSDRIAAITTVVGPNGQVYPDGTETYACNPRRPVPILMVYGTADDCVPFNGGVGSCGVPFISARQNYFLWSNENGCGNASARLAGSQGSAAIYTNPTCGLEREVSAVVIYGGVHEWPSRHFDVTRLTIEFFARHTM